MEYRPPSSGSPPPGPMAPPRSGADLPPAPLRRIRPEPSRRRPTFLRNDSPHDASTVVRRTVRKRMHLQSVPTYGLTSDPRSGGSPSKRSEQRDGHQAARPPSGDRPACPSCLPRGRLSLQGRSDRLASPGRVLRILGDEPRRDSRPSRSAGSGLALRRRHGTSGLNSRALLISWPAEHRIQPTATTVGAHNRHRPSSPRPPLHRRRP